MNLTEADRSLLRRLGSIGGKKRAANQTAQERKALATRANKARLKKRAAAKNPPEAAA